MKVVEIFEKPNRPKLYWPDLAEGSWFRLKLFDKKARHSAYDNLYIRTEKGYFDLFHAYENTDKILNTGIEVIPIEVKNIEIILEEED